MSDSARGAEAPGAAAPGATTGAVGAEVTAAPIDVGELLAAARTDADGAVLLFAGTVRNHNRGRAVARLHYEAYREMAEAKLEEIGREASERFEVGRIRAVHRTGTLEPGESSVAIVVAAPHRGAGYEASRYLIEEIKKRLPVWKREEYADGSARWLGGARPPATRPPSADSSNSFE